MNAPEKIYLVNENLDTTREWYITKQVGFDSIEYTRTDAYLKKLEEWLDEYISDMVEVDTRILVGSFKNYIEGKLDYGW